MEINGSKDHWNKYRIGFSKCTEESPRIGAELGMKKTGHSIV